MHSIFKVLQEWWKGFWQAPLAWLFVALVWGVLIFGLGQAVYSRYQRYKIAKIMDGKILGNSESHIFQVPTCPQYLSLSVKNRVEFETVQEAIEAGYRGSKNCAETIEMRREVESNDPDPEESDHDGPY